MDITQRTDEQFAADVCADVWRELLRVEGELVALGVHVHDRLQHVACDSPLWLKFISAQNRLRYGVIPMLRMAREPMLLPALDAKADGGTFGAMDAVVRHGAAGARGGDP